MTYETYRKMLRNELQRLRQEVTHCKWLIERITEWEKMPAGEDKDAEERDLKYKVHMHKWRIKRIGEIENELRAYDEHVAEQRTSTLLCDKVWNRRSNR